MAFLFAFATFAWMTYLTVSALTRRDLNRRTWRRIIGAVWLSFATTVFIIIGVATHIGH